MRKPADDQADDDGFDGTFVVLEPLLSDESFDDVYTDQFQPMVRLAMLMCGGRTEVARDIVQDSFVKLHIKWATVEHPCAYVRTTVVNGCRSRARWEGRRWRRTNVGEQVAVQNPNELFDVLATLPERQRAAIVLKYYEQCTENEIAAILGCRPGTVGSLVSRGLGSLRNMLTVEGGAS